MYQLLQLTWQVAEAGVTSQIPFSKQALEKPFYVFLCRIFTAYNSTRKVLSLPADAGTPKGAVQKDTAPDRADGRGEHGPVSGHQRTPAGPGW